MMRAGMVEACIAVGFAALSLIEQRWIAVSALAWILCLVARTGRARLAAAPGLLLVVGGALVLTGSAMRGWLSVEDGVTGGLVLLQLQRRLSRGSSGDGPHDDRVSLALAGLMLVVTAGRTQDFGFLLLAGLWCLALPLALLPARGLPRWTTVAIGLFGHLALSTALFLGLPRKGTAKEQTGKLTGFAPDVALGALDALLDDPAEVFRADVEGPPLPERVYWRGLALDGFDGTRWYSSTPPVATRLVGEGAVRVAIRPSGRSDGVLFLPGPAARVDAAGPVRGDAQGGWFVPPELSAEPYVVEVAATNDAGVWFEASAGDPARWLQLPVFAPEVSALARGVAGEGSDQERVDRLTRWLRSEVTYTRSVGDHGPRPLEDFLLHRREGHCEFVAAGLAVMARSVGIGSRVVNGFVGGDIDPLTGEWVVRRHHAHSWTEVLIDGRWQLVDATPSAPPNAPVPWDAATTAWWTDTVLSYDGDRQRRGLSQWLVPSEPWWWVRALLLACALGVVGIFARGLWRRVASAGRSPVRGVVTTQHRRARQALEDAGFSVADSCPPVEACRSLRGTAPDAAVDAMEALAWLHYEVVLGGVPSASVRGRSRELADVVVAALVPTATTSG